MRISDWSSDVCSSDLSVDVDRKRAGEAVGAGRMDDGERQDQHRDGRADRRNQNEAEHHAGDGGESVEETDEPTVEPADRKGVGKGKSVAVRVDRGGRRIHTKNKSNEA